MHNLSCENEFYLHENEKWFPYQRLSTYPRFETEARGNSEMAYWPVSCDLQKHLPLIVHCANCQRIHSTNTILWSTFGAFHYDCVFSTAKLFVQHCLECSTWNCYQISHLIATTEWHKSAGAHTLNCRQPSVCHAIQLRGVEKSEVANGHNENNSNN